MVGVKCMGLEKSQGRKKKNESVFVGGNTAPWPTAPNFYLVLLLSFHGHPISLVSLSFSPFSLSPKNSPSSSPSTM